MAARDGGHGYVRRVVIIIPDCFRDNQLELNSDIRTTTTTDTESISLSSSSSSSALSSWNILYCVYYMINIDYFKSQIASSHISVLNFLFPCNLDGFKDNHHAVEISKKLEIKIHADCP